MSDASIAPIGSSGSAIQNAEEFRFAISIEQTFVRSQFQVAIDNPKARGRRLTGVEVADAFGVKFLKAVIDEGSVPLASVRNPVGEQAKARREQLGLSASELSKRLNISPVELSQVEEGRSKMPIRKLENLWRHLTLDERRIGIDVDRDLPRPNLRLRYFSAEKGDEHNFSNELVAKIASSFWEMNRCANLLNLQSWFNSGVNPRRGPNLEASLLDSEQATDYRYPTHVKGAALARRARELLKIGEIEPVKSVTDILVNTLGLTVIPVDWPEDYAGATLSNSHSRAVAINLKGMNKRENTLRFTLAHELAHIMCDRDQQLDKLRVSSYHPDAISRPRSPNRDLPELRANAFAAEFLLPTKALKHIIAECKAKGKGRAAILERMQKEYGISLTSARYRLKNEQLEGFGADEVSFNTDISEGTELTKEISGHMRSSRFEQLAHECVEKRLIHRDTLESLLTD